MTRVEVLIASLKGAGLGVGLTTKDWANLAVTAERYLDQGWSALDVRSYLRCTEELAPELSELIALGRMKVISSKYKGGSKMVERAGTDKFEEPGIEDDSDLFDPEQKARLANMYAGKPKMPEDIRSNHTAQKKYITHLAIYYAERMEDPKNDSMHALISMFEEMFHNGFEAREFIL